MHVPGGAWLPGSELRHYDAREDAGGVTRCSNCEAVTWGPLVVESETMVGTYNRHDIQFCYPENWKIQENRSDRGSHCVTLQSPESGFWMLHVYESPESLQRLASEVKQSLQKEYQEVDVDPAVENIEGISMGGYDLQFYCLDFVVTARVRSFLLDGRACVLLSQAEDSEFDRIAPVFTAITTSLLQRADANTAERQRDGR